MVFQLYKDVEVRYWNQYGENVATKTVKVGTFVDKIKVDVYGNEGMVATNYKVTNKELESANKTTLLGQLTTGTGAAEKLTDTAATMVFLLFLLFFLPPEPQKSGKL